MSQNNAQALKPEAAGSLSLTNRKIQYYMSGTQGRWRPPLRPHYHNKAQRLRTGGRDTFQVRKLHGKGRMGIKELVSSRICWSCPFPLLSFPDVQGTTGEAGIGETEHVGILQVTKNLGFKAKVLGSFLFFFPESNGESLWDVFKTE